MSFALRPFQAPHADRLLAILQDRLTALDGSQCGTGKTFIGAWVAAQLKLKTLVVCPLSVVPTWEAILAQAGAVAFTVINWESAWRKLGRKVPWGKGSYFTFTDNWPFFIFDECHRAQSGTTNQGKLLIAATRQAKQTGSRILCLSATAADSPIKLGPLGYALGLHQWSDFRNWLDSHGCPEITLGRPGERQWVERVFLKPRQTEVMAQLHEDIFQKRGARLRIADIPDFPKTQVGIRLLDGHDREVQRLSAELSAFYLQRSALSKMSEDFLAKMTYARQAFEVAKVPALLDMMEDALETSKVAIFCNYSATLDALGLECGKRKWSFGFIRGEQGAFARQQTISSFQSDNLDVCLANVMAGGVGVSLHSIAKIARTALICPTFSSVDLMQCLGRVHRDGGGHSMQWLVYFKDTIEERVAKSVQAKIDRLDLLNDGDLDPVVVQGDLILSP